MAIPETAAFFNTAGNTSQELQIKQAWWNQVFFSPELHTEFPQLKMINWFEWNKTEPEVASRVDWTVTRRPEIREAFPPGHCPNGCISPSQTDAARLDPLRGKARKIRAFLAVFAATADGSSSFLVLEADMRQIRQ